jgi:hypothetical protein
MDILKRIQYVTEKKKKDGVLRQKHLIKKRVADAGEVTKQG